jgi:protoheme IX farnesyltransferase
MIELARGEVAAPSWAARFRALAAHVGLWSVLVKPRIALLVMLSAFIGGLLSGGPTADVGSVLEAALWIGCVASGSAAFNQVLERDTDALMARTARRPLVTGAIRTRDAILFAAALGAIGTLGLAWRFDAACALLALATLVAYALVYTPLKRVSTLNTLAGAIPGAMPPLLGAWAASGGPTAWGVWLFAFVFAWQFPHFLAIAWLYREDYARAGLKMLPAVPHSAGAAGRQSALYALVLLPMAFVPAIEGRAGWVWMVGALLLGSSYFAAALAFALREDARRARHLLFASLVYLPALFTVALFDPVVRITS